VNRLNSRLSFYFRKEYSCSVHTSSDFSTAMFEFEIHTDVTRATVAVIRMRQAQFNFWSASADFLLASSSNLKMEAICSSEAIRMSLNYITENHTLQ
jgi:hypothetical protein